MTPTKQAAKHSTRGPARRWRRFARRRPLLTLLAVVISVSIGLQATLAGLDWPGKLPNAVLVLTAHPDDEVMFFAPTILALTALGVQVFGLCLSIGNADALGAIRTTELIDSYRALGISESNVKNIDDPALQDSMTLHWDPEYIVQVVNGHMSGLPSQIDAIITFDGLGISSHPNHIACYQAGSRITSVPVYALASSSVLAKFLSLPMALFETRLAARNRESIQVLASPSDYLQSLGAMKQHGSQLVWFRYFYLVLSKYMYSNQLFRIS